MRRQGGYNISFENTELARMLTKILACLPARRWLYLLAALVCFSVIGFALYLQYYRYMEPCWLCYLQRLAVVLTGVVCLIAALHNPGQLGARVYAALITLTAGSGIGVAIRHLYIQSLPLEEVQNCGQTVTMLLEQMPYLQALRKMLEGSAECWGQEPVMGLTLPAWTLIFFSLMIVFGWLMVLKPKTAAART